jgi:tetratricopeptide (TPR) repeat protein
MTMLFAVSVFAAASPLFEQGNAKYKEGDFKRALESYRQLVETGQATAAVYFNLGNAALKAGEKGQALVYYERARKVSPRDEDLQWNIRVLKGALKDKIEDRSHFTLAASREFLERWTSDEIALLLTSFLALTAALGASLLLFPAASRRIRSLGRLVMAALFVSGLLVAWKWWETKDPRAVVLDRETSAHYGPSESETKAFLLHEGAQGKVLDETGEWFYLALPNGNSGWIKKNACEIV